MYPLTPYIPPAEVKASTPPQPHRPTIELGRSITGAVSRSRPPQEEKKAEPPYRPVRVHNIWHGV